jgi:Spy/CpxP family protein refolding chaperone
MPDAKREADVESKQSDEASDDAGMQADRRDTLRERAHTRANENMQHAREETIEVLREMGRSFAGFVNERRERLETLLASINATPEQRAKIDAIIRKDGDAAALQPTDAQRASMLREIIGVLTPEQRKQFLQDRRELAK